LREGCRRRFSVWDVNTSSATQIGQHDEGVRCVEYHAGSNLCLTGSWDQQFKAWDLRQRSLASMFNCRSKIFCMDVAGDKIILGLQNKQVMVFDIRNLRQAVHTKDSGLKYMLRSVKMMPDGNGYAAGSVEGRVAWEKFDGAGGPGPAKYAFKCHRKTEDGKETIFPVNCITFHPAHGTFATGGCDGVVSMWDGWAKKRLWRLGAYDTSISSLDFSEDGARLAVAISYTWERGEIPNPAEPKVLVRQINDQDCKPKGKK